MPEKAKRKRRSFSSEFNQDAIDLIVKQGYSFKTAAEAVGVEVRTLRDWHEKLAPPPKPGTSGTRISETRTQDTRGQDTRGTGRTGDQTVQPRLDAIGPAAPRAGARTDWTFPLPTVAEDPLDHVTLATLDEGNDLHLPATARALQRVDFVHPLDEHGPGGNRARSRAFGGRILVVEKRFAWDTTRDEQQTLTECQSP